MHDTPENGCHFAFVHNYAERTNTLDIYTIIGLATTHHKYYKSLRTLFTRHVYFML